MNGQIPQCGLYQCPARNGQKLSFVTKPEPEFFLENDKKKLNGIQIIPVLTSVLTSY